MNGRPAKRKRDSGGVLSCWADEQEEDHQGLDSFDKDMKSRGWLNKVFSNYTVQYVTADCPC